MKLWFPQSKKETFWLKIKSFWLGKLGSSSNAQTHPNTQSRLLLQFWGRSCPWQSPKVPSILGQFYAVILLNRNIPRAKTKWSLVSYVPLSVSQSPSASFSLMSLLLYTKHSFTPFSLPFFSTLLPGTCEKTGSAVGLFLFTVGCSALCQDST